jgi:hypothetical protein
MLHRSAILARPKPFLLALHHGFKATAAWGGILAGATVFGAPITLLDSELGSRLQPVCAAAVWGYLRRGGDSE